MRNDFLKGLKDGIPTCLGYLSVAFAFGIFAVGSGLGIFETVIMSMANVTSAGQFAAVPIICSGGTLIELAASQFVINLRYALMSVSLSQKLGKSITLPHKLIISFMNTDEVFAVASSQKGTVEPPYMYGLMLMPYIGWSAGTLLGAVAGDILPSILTSSLGLAIYGMFTAIVIPDAKRERSVALCVIISVLLSCAFRFIPLLSAVPDGFVIIICASAASALLALLCPAFDEEEAPR